MTDQVLIVFLKNPELGKVKTRIAKAFGDEVALAIYLRLLSKLRETLSGIDYDVHLYYSSFVDSEDEWNIQNISRFAQMGDDLGSRMQHAFENSFKAGYKKAVLVGSDIPDLSTEILNEAFLKLKDHDVVIGPAKDGGYYLIGMTRFHPQVLNLDHWSHSRVFHVTMDKIQGLGLSVSQTRLLKDLDEAEDLKDSGLM
ncbi:TIGR04282 family arsenosugar biosynthesis glycosyltransferase [Fulvivirga sedimenti]|uniref:TIGR04282 family arsenosugar biosynthesis glycosyltransferase n=1 Tax=Fulvivirga sedimenti TaxID=2879465 RepID=A0A9X1KYL8_9BACT|nr:TIGR04282 family arsenosugar biosynthesis glycosyltransferase [Fulvivirga sedimenti]MCA6078048.1 TIGR04282 family arsenosugar biosynthesis glycosyltransferase [Fulvivirga sedimenti]